MSVLLVGSMSLAVWLWLIAMSTFDLSSSLSFRGSFHAANLASSCAEEALEQIRVTNGTATSGGISIDSTSCTYTITDLGGESRSIAITASHGFSEKTLDIEIDSYIENLNIVSWDES